MVDIIFFEHSSEDDTDASTDAIVITNSETTSKTLAIGLGVSSSRTNL